MCCSCLRGSISLSSADEIPSPALICGGSCKGRSISGFKGEFKMQLGRFLFFHFLLQCRGYSMYPAGGSSWVPFVFCQLCPFIFPPGFRGHLSLELTLHACDSPADFAFQFSDHPWSQLSCLHAGSTLILSRLSSPPLGVRSWGSQA